MAAFSPERWPASRRNLWPASVGFRRLRGFYLPGYRDPAHRPLIGNASRRLIDLLRSGEHKVHIDERFSLHEAGLADRAIENRTTMGKVVIKPWRTPSV